MPNKYEDLKWTTQSTLSHIERDAGIILKHELLSFETRTLLTLRLFTLIDEYSGHWAGAKRDQTTRMIDFLERYLDYGREESRVAIQIWRHPLAHIGNPRIYRDGVTSYTWQWNYENEPGYHWKLEKVDFPENTYRLYFGFYNLLRDLRIGLQKYCDELITSEKLQNNYGRYLGQTLA